MKVPRETVCNLDEARESLLPSREKIIALLRCLGLYEAKVKHSIDVADLALRIARAVEDDGIAVNMKIVEAGALLHDIGLTKTFDDFSPEHSVIGADMIRKLGFPERVARCAEVHEGVGAVTRKEAEELKYPILPLKDSYAPQSIEEKIVSASDLFIAWSKEFPEEGHKKSEFDSLGEPETIIDVCFPYWRDVYKKKLNKTITRDHPLLRGATWITEFVRYVRPEFLES